MRLAVCCTKPTSGCCRPLLRHRYEDTRKDVAKWVPLVKANREAPTLRFAAGNEDVPRASTTAALTAKFTPVRCAQGINTCTMPRIKAGHSAGHSPRASDARHHPTP